MHVAHILQATISSIVQRRPHLDRFVHEQHLLVCRLCAEALRDVARCSGEHACAESSCARVWRRIETQSIEKWHYGIDELRCALGLTVIDQPVGDEQCAFLWNIHAESPAFQHFREFGTTEIAHVIRDSVHRDRRRQ